MKTLHRLKSYLIDSQDHRESSIVSTDPQAIAYYSQAAATLGFTTTTDTIQAERLYSYYHRKQDSVMNFTNLTAEEVRDLVDEHFSDLLEDGATDHLITGVVDSIEIDEPFYGLNVDQIAIDEIDTPPLIHAAQEVIDNWSSGDLAGAVNMLDEALELSTS